MKRKAGFTLIELVVAIVMACILLASLTPLLTLAQNGTYTAQRSTRAAQAGDAISEYIMNLLKNAERVYIGDDGDHKPDDWAQWNSISVSKSGKDGLLAVNGATVYPLEYQEGCALTLSALGDNRDHLTLGVALGDNRSSDTLYSKQSSVRLAGLEQNGFGQLEGLTGAQVWCDGFPGEPQTIGTASNVRSLVIYFKGDGSLLPEFTPGAGGAPADPTPGPSAFSVTLPARMEVEVGEQTSLRGYVTWPQGVDAASKGKAFWELSASGNGYLSITNEDTGVFPTAHLYGLNATAPDQPVRVTLTVTCTVNGVPQTASATCDVTVWQEAVGELQIKKGTAWDGNAPDLNNTTILYKRGEQISLGAYAPEITDGHPLCGLWESSNPDVLPTAGSSTSGAEQHAFYKQIANTVGSVTLTFTANGKIPGGGKDYPMEGFQGTVTILIYDPNDVKFSLAFESSASNTSNVFFTKGGDVGDVALLTLDLSHVGSGLRPQLVSYFQNNLTASLRHKAEGVSWLTDYSLFQQPFSSLGLPSAQGVFTVRLPLVYARDVNGNAETLTQISAELRDQKGLQQFSPNVITPNWNDPLTITVKKVTTVPLSDSFIDGKSRDPLGATIKVSADSLGAAFNISLADSIQNKYNLNTFEWNIRRPGDAAWVPMNSSGSSSSSFENLQYSFSGKSNMNVWKKSSASRGTYEIRVTFNDWDNNSYQTEILTLVLE